ncbi:hypothetical protein CLV24_13922 [Pontibacter ummariensis]|uniref:Uncharacterized protein n=1 Tax=Pontibacter ummariensis TaxID=1610492 RepID=A0A239LBQ3_9BACT|nr:hypothetical protein [Pontibacter ummariensis]PRY03674.1 hypothetical protein CLV24_13922 [Pontibacter ummariensis]SNT28077.1 hypothetical protein SAMN06296052_13910 [Pontibacter ummariensis]
MLSSISTAPIFTLIDIVKHGNTDILTLLNLSETDFFHVPFEEILNSSNDVSFGVNQIRERYNKPIACIFNHFVVKHYDSNDKEYYFIAHTKDLSLISRMFNKLCSEFGGGAYNEYKSVSFYKKDKVLKLTAGVVEDGDLPFSHFWFQHEMGITYKMSYLQHPFQQLQFMIRVNQRMPNRAPRTDSILSLLNFDINNILSEQESYRHIEVKDSAVAFVDYVCSLREKEFGLFDVLAVRIFGNTKSFDQSVDTCFS